MCFVARHVPSAQAWLLVVYDKKRKKKEEESPSEAKPVHPKREVLAGDERSQRGSPFFLCHQSVILVIKHPPTAAAALSLFLSSYRRPPAVFPFISTRARSSAPRSLGGARRRREDGEERAGDARLRPRPPRVAPRRRGARAEGLVVARRETDGVGGQWRRAAAGGGPTWTRRQSAGRGDSWGQRRR